MDERAVLYTVDGNPGQMTAAAAAGQYELWYVQGPTTRSLFRTTITVTPFQGELLAPESVVAGTEFEVTWNGPDGPGAYVTIVKAGATKGTQWPYFSTASGGNPVTLQAPIEMARRGLVRPWRGPRRRGPDPIVVTPFTATVDAPVEAAPSSTFDAAWTGPDGPGDYITIAPVGSPEGTYLSYCYTYVGPTCTLTAPDASGPYEVRYVTGAGKTLASDPIAIKYPGAAPTRGPPEIETAERPSARLFHVARPVEEDPGRADC